MSSDFKVEYLPNGDFNVVSLAPSKAAAVNVAPLPPYVFDGAVVMLDGHCDIIRNTYHKAAATGLWVHFKSGLDICFDEKRVQPPLGVLPNIIYKGAMVDLLEHNHASRDDGSWAVKDFYFSQRENDLQSRLHLVLARQDKTLETIFNAQTVREQGGFDKIRLVKRIALKPQPPK